MAKKLAIITALIMIAASLAACGSTTPEKGETTKTAETTATSDSAEAAEEQSTKTVEDLNLQEAVMMTADNANSADRTNITDDAEQKNLTHEIFVNNTKEEIFKNHTSVTVNYINHFDKPGEFADYYYLRSDNSFMTGPNYQEYSSDRVIYFNTTSEEYPEPLTMRFLDFSEEYDGIEYWYQLDDEKESFDFDHEKITEMYIEDGFIKQYSKMDETESKKYVEENMLVSYTGGSILCEAAIDADTYELSSVIYYLEKDGKTYPVDTINIEFDQPEPEELGTLLAKFDDSAADKMITYTYVLNPGTDKEVTKSLTVAKDSIVDFYSKDIFNPEYYKDYECTKPLGLDEKIDKTSDVTLYIRNGDENSDK